jgi:hypothetical protein
VAVAERENVTPVATPVENPVETLSGTAVETEVGVEGEQVGSLTDPVEEVVPAFRVRLSDLGVRGG